MKIHRSLWRAAACLLLLAGAPAMATQQPLTVDQARALLHSLHFRTGEVSVPAAHARLQLSPGFSYLDGADARKVLEQLWQNPPDPSVLGMIVPGTDARTLLDENSYAVVMTYNDGGYVSDKDAEDIDYGKILSQMQESVRDANPKRSKLGYPTLTLVGWAEPPHYDQASHKLYWAKDIRFAQAPQDTLNYDIRVLGRHGFLSLNAVSVMNDLPTVKSGMQQVLTMVKFDQGSRYVDFDSKTDRVAAYGISALIAGTLAAKVGLFAKLFAMLAAAWKFLAAGVLAVGAYLRKLFRRNKA